MNMKGICKTVADKKMLCAILTTVGGLHMVASENQPVLGMLNLGGVSFAGKEIGVQTVLGAALVVCGGCCIVACM